MVNYLSWHRCHKEGWSQDLVPEAYAHPAKVSRGLARKIYAHAVERGWLKEGDVCLDPFAGIGGFALDAMFHGLHWVGCELEARFVDLGQQNIDLWNKRYRKGLPRWGTAIILRGDSRRLVEVLEGATAEGVISSPPYAKSMSSGQSGIDWTKTHDSHRRNRMEEPFFDKMAGGGAEMRYGTNPANLGNMPTGEPPPQCIVSSPPYANAVNSHGEGPGMAGNEARRKRIEAGSETERAAQSRGVGYGATDGQLAAMREGDAPADYTHTPGSLTPTEFDARAVTESATFTTAPRREQAIECEWEEGNVDAVIASPPFHSNATKTGGEQGKGWYRGQDLSQGLNRLKDDYVTPDSDGQLAALPEGEPPQIDGLVSSPPWEKQSQQERGSLLTQWCEQHNRDPDAPSRQQLYNAYGQSNGQVGNTTGDTFWSAAKTILLQCHQVLAPGGYAIFVTKRFVRNKQIVEFSQQWADLCQSCGFELVEWIKAWLVEERETKLELFTADTSATMHKLDGKSEDVEGENFEQGRERKRVVERKSFFRRLAEKKGSPRIDWEDVLVFRKPDGEGRGEIVRGVVSSPPFISSDMRKGGSNLAVDKAIRTGRNPNSPSVQSCASANPYGADPANLANMKQGNPPTK